MREIWKDIPGYEGFYQASSFGNIRSRYRVLKPQQCTNGYLFVCLSVRGKVSQHRVHRLVAMTFIDNPNNYPEVNHIDEDKTNNNISNLEWISVYLNRMHGTRNKRAHSHGVCRGEKNPMYGRLGAANPLSKAIIQLDFNGNIVGEYAGIKEAARMTGANASSISRAAKGKIKSTHGYVWKYKSTFIHH